MYNAVCRSVGRVASGSARLAAPHQPQLITMSAASRAGTKKIWNRSGLILRRRLHSSRPMRTDSHHSSKEAARAARQRVEYQRNFRGFEHRAHRKLRRLWDKIISVGIATGGTLIFSRFWTWGAAFLWGPVLWDFAGTMCGMFLFPSWVWAAYLVVDKHHPMNAAVASCLFSFLATTGGLFIGLLGGSATMACSLVFSVMNALSGETPQRLNREHPEQNDALNDFFTASPVEMQREALERMRQQTPERLTSQVATHKQQQPQADGETPEELPVARVEPKPLIAAPPTAPQQPRMGGDLPLQYPPRNWAEGIHILSIVTARECTSGWLRQQQLQREGTYWLAFKQIFRTAYNAGEAARQASLIAWRAEYHMKPIPTPADLAKREDK